MVHYQLNNAHEFVIKGYANASPFASFLPGVAGIDGIPMWVYYVNRGQAIVSFGIENKDQPLVDFSPANMAYKRAETEGFRTFIKVNGTVIECFSTRTHNSENQTLIIEPHGVRLEETFVDLGLTIQVRYTTLVHQPYPGLIRHVKFLSKQPLTIEFVDGLSILWPYGVNQWTIKNMANLGVAWFDVFNLDQRVPFYRNRSTTGDTALVDEVTMGHFSYSIDQSGQRLVPIVDNTILFGPSTSLLDISEFVKTTITQLQQVPQVTTNQLTAAWTTGVATIKGSYEFYTLLGRADSLSQLQTLSQQWTTAFFAQQFTLSKALIENLTSPVQTKTNDPRYDAYVRQCLLDNTLRGGTPIIFKGKNEPLVYHVFSRIHGDMEREYNNFSVEPSFYSQGNGSFRDVNQNRRNDVYFEPQSGLYNIRQFYELIQVDGYNPLSIKGSQFHLQESDRPAVLALFKEQPDALKNLFSKPFTPGMVMNLVNQKNIALNVPANQLIEKILVNATQTMDVAFGTGYWSDHWTYNHDLLDHYLNVFPDLEKHLYFETFFGFYQSPMTPYPRSLRYVQLSDGRVRQLDPFYKDDEKIAQLKVQSDGLNYHQTKQKTAFTVPFFAKLWHLGLLKFLTLDPFALGLMMDGDKPGWNDAMNGLPGIFGSGLSETIELIRVFKELHRVVARYGNETMAVPVILVQLWNDTIRILDTMKTTTDEQRTRRYEAWQTLREQFLAAVRMSVDDTTTSVRLASLSKGLMGAMQLLDDSVQRATVLGNGLVPTFLTYEAVQFKLNGQYHPHLKFACVDVTQWRVRPLPHFLEAPARLLKISPAADAQTIYEKVKKSPLWDEKTKMFVTSVPLDQEDLSIGRIRAFTAGWLEREANFMHMSYKFLLGLLKAGQYEPFFQEIQQAYPCFMDPAIYGRSILENSSFIATSRNPNPRIHGKGYVARLTGTTAELLSMHIGMFLGYHLFTMNQTTLQFQLEPVLPASWFSPQGTIETTLFQTIPVVYQSVDSTSPLLGTVHQYTVYQKSKKIVIKGSRIEGPLALAIRNREVERIEVTVGGYTNGHH